MWMQQMPPFQDGNALNIQVFLNVFGVLTLWRLVPFCFLRPLFLYVFKDLYFLHFLKDLLIPIDCFKAFSFILPGKQLGVRISYCKIRI
ncbi:hypothetical protein EO93_13370 [Methanosarcina sp. 1.H.A.2.2]|nr:hypothetical protein EO93_13370 [Methanosarcina sp. 1.H.A.2.2]